MNTANPSQNSPASSRWSRWGDRCVRAFHAYGSWLVGISWKRFTLLALLLLITSGILKDLLSFRIHTAVDTPSSKHAPRTPRAERDPTPSIRIDKGSEGSQVDGVDISIDAQGIRITKRPASAASASASASAPQDAAIPVAGPLSPAEREEVAKALQALRDEVRAVLREAIDQAKSTEVTDGTDGAAEGRVHEREISLGEFFPQLALLWIMASIIIKITYKGELQARADAAQAHLTAESEQIRRQAAEARVAAVQAQVEPHFLFNTLASIDHLIETDPPRASRMQKSLIALLRATLPNLRDDSAKGPLRNLGQEADVIVPYLDIMKVRMEDRLRSQVDIPEGLRSAQFPPLMLQGLVENAIKHGLEPKAEGGQLTVQAQVVDGALSVTVRDKGVGLSALAQGTTAATAGTGTGLANIRERLKLLYGDRAALVLSSLPEGGTLACLTLPYQVQPSGPVASGAQASTVSPT